jgi:hypothetical protein
MYRIELSPGEETAFRSIEELAVAIRRGVVTSKARIWHNASGKWLPIQFHPHYKVAAEMPLTQADLVVGPPVAPLSALSIPDPSAPPRVTPFKPMSPYHQPRPQDPAAEDLPLIEPLGSMSAPEPIRPQAVEPEPYRPLSFKPLPKPVVSRAARTADQPVRKKQRPKGRKPSRRALRVAFVGALLIGGAHLLVSAGGTLRQDGLGIQRRLVPAPADAIKRDSPRTVAGVIPVLRNSSVPGGAATLSGGMPGPASTLGSLIPPVPSVPPPAHDTVPEVLAAPPGEIPDPAPAAADSLASRVVDSSAKKALKGILRAVSGAPATEKAPPKR